MVIGAPNAQTDQENIYRGGAVYRCHVERQHCEPIPFDVQGELHFVVITLYVILTLNTN